MTQRTEIIWTRDIHQSITELDREKVTTIILPGKQHASYFYPDLEVSIDLFTTCDAWTGTVEQMKKSGAILLTLRQYLDYVNLLRSKHAFYGTGARISEKEIKQIYDKKINCWKTHFGEVFDGQFLMKNYFSKEICMKYHKINPDGTLVETIIKLEEHLGNVSESLLKRALRRKFKDNFIEDLSEINNRNIIDVKCWLENATAQGLPPPNIPEDAENGIKYSPPKHGNVINFGNYGGLNCQENPAACRGEYNTFAPGKLKVVRPAWIKK